MNIWLYVYFIGSALALLALLFMVCSMRVHLSWLKDCYASIRDRWAQTEARAKRMEKAVEWFLARRGMKLDCPSCSWEWAVVPMEKPRLETGEVWKQMAAHRDEIVYALYEANKKALKDWDKEKKKGGKK